MLHLNIDCKTEVDFINHLTFCKGKTKNSTNCHSTKVYSEHSGLRERRLNRSPPHPEGTEGTRLANVNNSFSCNFMHRW